MLAQIEGASRSGGRRKRLRRFVADASHELRTPLTSIRGYAELYRQGAATARRTCRGCSARIEAEATRMSSMVDDLLVLARLDQQRPLEQQRVDVAALASDAVTDARAVQPDRPLDFATHGRGPFVVLGDEARLRQVYGNLVGNALSTRRDRYPCTYRPHGRVATRSSSR